MVALIGSTWHTSTWPLNNSNSGKYIIESRDEFTPPTPTTSSYPNPNKLAYLSTYTYLPATPTPTYVHMTMSHEL